jgi:hypothetical protein
MSPDHVRNRDGPQQPTPIVPIMEWIARYDKVENDPVMRRPYHSQARESGPLSAHG